jgi:hypothetical protein
MFRSVTFGGFPDRREALPPELERLTLQQRLEIGHQRHRQASDRYYAAQAQARGRGSGELEGVGNDLDRRWGSALARGSAREVAGHGSRRAHARGQEQHRQEDEGGFLATAWHFFRTQLKLLVLLGVIVYFSSLINVQQRSDGWLSTRRIGYRQAGYCTSVTDHYGVTNGDAANSDAPFVFQSKSSSPGGVSICAQSSTSDSLSALMLSTPTLQPFADEDYLQKEVRNLGEVYTYFPSTFAIMILAHVSTLLSIALALYPSETPAEAFLHAREKTYLVRINHVAQVCLIVLLLWSSFTFRLMMDEVCESAFGLTTAKVKGMTVEMATMATFCVQLEDLQLVIASVVNPPEPYVKDFALYCRILVVLLVVGIAIKPRPNEGRPLRGVVPITSLMELVNQLNNRILGRDGDRDRDRDRDGRRNAANGSLEPRVLRRQMNMSLDFLNRYSDIARRSEQANNWKLISRSDAMRTVGAEEGDLSQRTCCICLDHLFPQLLQPVPTASSDTPGNAPTLLVAATEAEAGAEADLEAGPHASASLPIPIRDGAWNDVCCFGLPCGHIYHKPCILEWAVKNSTCPECRADLNGGKPKLSYSSTFSSFTVGEPMSTTRQENAVAGNMSRSRRLRTSSEDDDGEGREEEEGEDEEGQRGGLSNDNEAHE